MCPDEHPVSGDSSPASRLESVRARLRVAAERAGRDPSSITLIAVSKTQPAARLTEILSAGVVDLGENRVQEASEKKPHVHGEARWHLIGPLQRNKARTALETFDVLHTLDRPELAARLQFLMTEHRPARRFPVLLEINVGREAQKAGVFPEDAEILARTVIERCPALRLEGLMAIPPFAPDPEASRPYFNTLAALRTELEQNLGCSLSHLSMGMSHDFEVAVEEGATMVRVGTAIFGPRRPR